MLGATVPAPRPVEVTGVPEAIAPVAVQTPASGGYEILAKLGEGAMGAVSLARDPVLRRTVALKSILPEASRDGALLQRFIGEMQITAQLDHPHIVPVYGFDRRDASLSYAMKLVQGKELEQLLDEAAAMLQEGKPLDVEHALKTRIEIFVKVCDAVAYAHSRGVLHRDLKPSNVMIGSFNEVYVVDWGIARPMGTAGALQDRAAASVSEDTSTGPANQTRVGEVIGTPLYMSPEQAAGKNAELDGRSDQYALGLMLQEIVTLQAPIPGETIQMVLVHALQGKRSPMKPSRDVPRELVAIVDRACRTRPDERYASVAELAADLRRFMNDEEVHALPDSLPRRAGRWLSKHRMLAIGLLAGTLLLGLTATGGVWAFNQIELAQKKNREVRLVEVQADSSTRAQALDLTLVRYQESLQRLAGAAGIMLEKGDVPPLELLTQDRFEPGERAVSGLVDSAFYGKRVSFDWLVAARAADANAEHAASSLGALQALGMTLPRTMIESLGEAERQLPPAAQLEVLATSGAPVRRIAFALENGLSAAYPGMAGLAPDTDGRNAELYQQARDERRLVWGTPAPEGNQTMILRCAAPIQTRDGTLLGAVQFEIDVARAITAALSANNEEVAVSVLVDRSGKVLAQNAKDPADREPDVLASDEVKAAIARGESGYLATQRNGRDVLVTYQPLASMDWYLVTVADVDKLEEAKPSSAPRPSPPPRATTKPSAPRPPTTTAPAAPPTETSASASASASTAPSASAPPSPAPPRPGTPPVRRDNPFDPWPIYQKKPKPQ
jgi:serine/threonine-protein kinase